MEEVVEFVPAGGAAVFVLVGYGIDVAADAAAGEAGWGVHVPQVELAAGVVGGTVEWR